ncbi:MAG: hypothetical protein SFU25_02500 [Candidatus Caenarcaniphilales bacterium]|nr:hypothetical protein [Candidatus Caenarcaniphilales bacterium]
MKISAKFCFAAICSALCSLSLFLPSFAEGSLKEDVDGLKEFYESSKVVCQARFKDNKAKYEKCQDVMFKGFMGVTSYLYESKINLNDNIENELDKGNQDAQIFAACSSKWKKPEGFYWDRIKKCIDLELEAAKTKTRDYAEDI